MLFFKQIIISSFLVAASVIATTVDVNTGNSNNGNDGTKVNVQKSSSVVNILPASLSIVAIAAMYIV